LYGMPYLHADSRTSNPPSNTLTRNKPSFHLCTSRGSATRLTRS
jgi:hypothetical protein